MRSIFFSDVCAGFFVEIGNKSDYFPPIRTATFAKQHRKQYQQVEAHAGNLIFVIAPRVCRGWSNVVPRCLRPKFPE
jgi:hypothetical protein